MTSQHAPPKSSRLHPVVKAMGWVSFFTDLSSEMIYPLLPIFVTGSLKASFAMFGLIEGLAEGIPALLRYFAGAWADRLRNRKWLILSGYSLSTLVKPLIGASRYLGLALAPWAVLALRALDKIGKGVRGAPRDALLADYSEGMQGRAFGYQRALDHAGAIAGGLTAYALLQWLELEIVWSISLSIVPGILAVLAIVFFVHDRHERRGQQPPLIEKRPPLSRCFWLYAVAASLFALANSSDAFLLLRAHEMGMPAVLLPLAWALLHVVKSGTSFIGGALSDRWGRKPLLMAGWLLYAAIYAIFACAAGDMALWPLFAAYGVFFGATEGVGKALVADLVPAGNRGRAFGILGMLEGGLLIPSSILTGWLWDITGSGAVPLLLNALCAVAAAVWLLLAVPAAPRFSYAG